ncbi:MAG: S-adenosylmethionine decarboxylase proenzyme [Chlamydiia bacterium]|nr:S-adenosylmethionine decarboxylase proenzyme [Chlamydiia bacterium]
MQDDDFAFVGRHFVASYYDCDPELLDHVKHLKEALCKAIEGSGASLLNMTVHKFAPHGVTLVALLSESHASIHTYPEHGSCFVDLFTCGTSCSSENFHKVLSEELLAKSSKTMILNRE